MRPFVSKKELQRRCRNPSFCIACFRVREGVRVDEHHVCEECRRGSSGMPGRLRVITLKNGKSYSVDNRLRELRNIHNPFDSIGFAGLMRSSSGLWP